MNELLLCGNKPNKTTEPYDLTFFFQEDPKQVIGGWTSSGINVFSILLDDEYLTNHPNELFVASSVSGSKQARYVKDSSEFYWMPVHVVGDYATGKIWLSIKGLTKIVKKVRIVFHQILACRYIRVTSNNKTVGIKDVRNLSQDFYPLETPGHNQSKAFCDFTIDLT